MVRAESVITAGIGAILGTVLGIVFALIVSRPLADEGFVFVAPDRLADRVLRPRRRSRAWWRRSRRRAARRRSTC